MQIGTRLRASVAAFVVALMVALSMHEARAAVAAVRPTDASLVVLRLNDAREAQLARLRQTSAAAPSDLQALHRYVEALLLIGSQTGNERYYGFAEQAVDEAPATLQPALQLLHAELQQHRHDFLASEQTLSALIRREPRNREALLMRAQVRIHLHEAEKALSDCIKLTLAVDLLTSTTCAAQAQAALAGDVRELEHSFEVIATLLTKTTASPATRSWSAGIAAEIAARLGKADAANDWYREAYGLNPDNHYARIAYADWLIGQAQFPEAQAVLRNGNSASIKFRAALAARSPDSPEARQLQLLWREATTRGEWTQLRDQARFESIVLKDAERALRTARENFRKQREPEDALLLAQLAAERRDSAALGDVRDWRRSQHFVDCRFDAYLGTMQ